MLITIFTPAYNRAYSLDRLYESLLKQTKNNFEWLIVDDGSTDNTSEIIQSFVNENKVSIHYFKQENGGKHRAINKGIQVAKGELFFIVDSDDCLTENAIDRILFYYEKIRNKEKAGGICGRKALFNGKIVGVGAFDPIISDSLSIRYKERVTGDLAEIFKTSILSEFPFPEYEGEKFCPEALIWNRIAQKYQILYFNEPIYLCEYRADGLSAKIIKVRMKSPLASMDTYYELLTYNIPYLQKFKAAINFWRFAFCSKRSFTEKMKRVNSFLFVGVLLGYLLHLKDVIYTSRN